jgi:phosphoribosylanthranilate isomerase
MKVKVCGIKNQINLEGISTLPIDMIGLNFYSKSSRFVDQYLNTDGCPDHISKIGVFVNHDIEDLKRLIKKYKLDYIQLHGNESPEYVNQLTPNFKVIKAISIENKSDFQETAKYDNCSYFLFDTRTHLFGGSGNKFNWSFLNAYEGETPFLLAGGIGPNDYRRILDIDHHSFDGIDINSKFEIEPGIKDVNLIKAFLKKINKQIKR